jgi:acetyltransferase-like isoleucine patch superfamily enzyme
VKSTLRIVDVMPGGRRLLALSQRARTAAWLRGCTSVGVGVLAHGRPRFTGVGEVHISDDVLLTSEPSPLTLDVAAGARLTLGRGSHLGSGASLRASIAISLGANVVVGPDAVLDDSPTTLASGTGGVGLRIDDGVLVGARSRVRGPIHVGRGAVILPDSEVLDDVAAATVVGGSPARPLQRSAPQAPAAHAARSGLSSGSPAFEAPATPASAERSGDQRVSWRGTLLADFTIDALTSSLTGVEPGVTIDAEVAPFGQVVQTLHQLSRAEHKRDFALVWTRPESALPSFAKKLEGLDVPLAELEAEVDAFAGLDPCEARGEGIDGEVGEQRAAPRHALVAGALCARGCSGRLERRGA